MLERFFFDYVWSGPVVKTYKWTEIDNEGNKKECSYDSRLENFKKLSYEDMERTIQNIEEILEKYKEIMNTKKEKEIKETEEKLKRLKGL